MAEAIKVERLMMVDVREFKGDREPVKRELLIALEKTELMHENPRRLAGRIGVSMQCQ